MVSCKKIIAELSAFMEDSVDRELKAEIEHHLSHCRRCSVLLDSTRKVLIISGDDRTFEVPAGYGERLHQYLNQKLQTGK